MKPKRIALLLLLLLTALCGCDLFSNPVTVMIDDNGATVFVKGRDSMTVGELLSQAGVTLGEGDTTEPDGSVVWRDVNADEIVVKRAAAASGSAENTSAPATDAPASEPAPVNTIVGSDEEGYRYVGADGTVDPGYCDGVTVDGADWNVINGVAAPVIDDWDKTLHAALRDVAQCTDSSMSKEQKLKACFDYLKTAYLEGVRHNPPYRESDWPVVCANDLFVYGKGDCYSYGAAFAFMAKAIGCDEVYACNSGGHGWAEVEGKYYDPEWSMHSNKYTYFGVGANETDVKYAVVNENSEAWKRVRL